MPILAELKRMTTSIPLNARSDSQIGSRGLEKRQRRLGGFGTDSSHTPRWRERDSNSWSLSRMWTAPSLSRVTSRYAACLDRACPPTRAGHPKPPRHTLAHGFRLTLRWREPVEPWVSRRGRRRLRKFSGCRLFRLSGAEVRRRNAGRIRGFEEGESPRPTLTTRRVGGSPLSRSKGSWSASWSTR